MIETRNLVVQTGSATLLHDMSAAIRPGRITAIVGPNGAGKSTLLACLAGLRAPTDGAVLLNGTSIRSIPVIERARRIGYLPQESPVHWNISVRALVSLGRYPHRQMMAGESAQDRVAVDRALSEMALTSLADRMFNGLSGGERARALLARVLAGEPDWILADEPMAALDLAHRYALMERLRSVAARGVGILVVIHDLALAARMADDALILSAGQLAAIGLVDDVLVPECLGPIFGVDFSYGVAPDGVASLIYGPRS